MDRRSLLDDDETPQGHDGNVFGDENEVEDFDFVADGFRPGPETTSQNATTRHDREMTETPSRASSVHYAPFTERSVAVRNSIRKSRSAVNPFASPEDGAEDSAGQQPGLSFEPDDVRRSISSASSAMYARTHSPRFGSSANPSHPYNMYPQGTVVRSSSTATASTAAVPGRSSSTRAVPQHPYAMYPQGVDEDHLDVDEDDDLIQENPVPVGFSGLGNSYRRRMGPDGEEQDIIGTDGHTEQLPPYSRYPEDGPEKVPLLVPTQLHSRAPVHGSDPGMSLMHTPIQPTQSRQSMSDESNLERPQSMGHLALLPSRSSVSSGQMSAKKSWNEKSWSERRKTRLCWGRIKLWWLLVLLGIIIFVLCVIGGIAAGFLAGRKQSQQTQTPSGDIVTVITSLYDASVIASPTSSAPPTGTFALTLSTPQETQCDCLVQKYQQIAWDCNLAPNSELAINVTIQQGQLGANLFYASNDSTLYYGAQTSSMDTYFAQFLTVKDNDDPDNGPAFYFQKYYNKTVIVPETSFDPAGRRFRRGFPISNNEPITPGSKPWFCVWNNTLIEGFIYIQKPMAPSTSLPSSRSATLTGSGASGTITSAAATDTITSATAFTPGVTETYTGSAGGFPAWLSLHKPQASAMPGGGSPNYIKARQASPDLWNVLQKYPNLIKIEERRAPNSANDMPAYCQQYQVLWDGHANWVADINGNPIKVMLQEQDPSYSAYQSAGIAGSKQSINRRAANVAGGCHCQWISGGT